MDITSTTAAIAIEREAEAMRRAAARFAARMAAIAALAEGKRRIYPGKAKAT